jgi:hypothetical protein
MYVLLQQVAHCALLFCFQFCCFQLFFQINALSYGSSVVVIEKLFIAFELKFTIFPLHKSLFINCLSPCPYRPCTSLGIAVEAPRGLFGPAAAVVVHADSVADRV